MYKNLLTIILLLSSIVITGFAEESTEKKNVVILSGASNHNWKASTPKLKEILEDSGQFKVDVVLEPEKLTKEFLSNYDVLLSDWNNFGKNPPPPWSEELKKSYVEFVRNGGGHVVVHAGSSSFYDWDDYHAICCATWRGKTGHGKHHEFEVRISNPDHPVTKGMENFKIHEELWFRPFVHPNAKVITESFSKTTGNWEPSSFVGQFGEGRCFCTLLGHGAYYMENDGFKNLLIRGTAWAAKIDK